MAEPTPAAERPKLRSRLSLLVLLAIVFGAPAIVTLSLVTQEILGEVTTGPQPGGVLTGIVVDEDGRPLPGELVRLSFVPPAGGGSGEAAAGPVEGVPTARTDAEGRFELRAPPFQGHYELRAGGELLQRVVKGISFLDPKGETIEPQPVTLTLRPGAVLELEFVRSGGGLAAGGTYTLVGKQREGGLLFGFVPFEFRNKGRIEAGRLRLDGIPPLQGKLVVEFETGETAELELEIEPGLNASRIEL